MTSFRATLCPIFQFFNKSDTLFDLSCTQMYSYKCDGTQTLDHTHRIRQKIFLSLTKSSNRSIVSFRKKCAHACLVQTSCSPFLSRTSVVQDKPCTKSCNCLVHTVFVCSTIPGSVTPSPQKLVKLHGCLVYESTCD